MTDKRKIQIQQKIIQKLEAENKSLKHQLTAVTDETSQSTVAKLETYICEYQKLIDELKELKNKYKKKLKELDEVKTTHLKTFKNFIRNFKKQCKGR